MESVVVSFTYPIVIFRVDISSIVTEELQSVISVGLPNSHMQGSPLMERKFNINYLRDHVTQGYVLSSITLPFLKLLL